MSKRLPYYQSEPAEYLAGDIMFCSYAAQGVFSIIRALYWQKDCQLSLDQARRRCKGADELIDELINEHIIKIVEGDILISFLDEQYEERVGKSKTNSENGKKGAAKRWANKGGDSESIAPPLKNDSESIALREEERREYKKKEENTIKDKEEKVYSIEIHNCFEKCLDYFDDHLHPQTEPQKNSWLDTIDKLNRIENLEFHLIQKIVKKARNDDFWSTNFLSLTKLRKKNKEGIMYVVVFYEKFKTNGKSNNQKGANTVSQSYVDGIINDLQSE